MPTLREERERIKFLLREGLINDDTRVKIVIPSLDAKRKIQNAAKSKRIVLVTDEHNFSEFAAMREAYMQACDENPTLATQAIIEAMRQFDVKHWLEEQC